MATETTQQIVREAPEIEAYKLKLLQEAQKLAFNQAPGAKTLAEQLPSYQVAGFSPAQTAAMKAAETQGVGAFTPYMTAANTALSDAYKTTGEAADTLRGADTRAQFTDAQKAMGQAGGATANITSGIGQIPSVLFSFSPRYCQIFVNTTVKVINLRFQRQKNVKLHQIINSPVVFTNFDQKIG